MLERKQMNGQERNTAAARDDTEGWSAPAAQEIPQPSYAPATLAMGIALLLWGIATAWPISAAGLVLAVVSLARWIGELTHGE
jgi:hypothetical protein